MKKAILFMVFVGVCSVLLSGCETLKGLGQDIENTGANLRDLLSK